MEHVLNWVWQGALLVGVAAGCSRLSRRLGAAARYRLWWGTLLGVLGLPAVSSVLRHSASGLPAAAAIDASAPVLEVPVLLNVAAPALAAFWACWTAMALVRLVAAVILLRRIKGSCTSFPSDREARLTEWRAVAGVGRRATLAVSPVVGSAAVLGGRSPVIAVSSSLLERFTDRELDQIVLHEWAHVQRRDDGAQLIQQIISAVCGLHPAVWWCARQLQLERELACDEWVVDTTGSAKAYAACLVKLAVDRARPGPVAAPAAIAPAHLTIRIMRLLRPRRPHNALGSAATGGLAALSVAGSLGLVASVPLVGTLSPQPEAMPAPHVATSGGAERDARQATVVAAPPTRSEAASGSRRPRSRAGRALVAASPIRSTGAPLGLNVTHTAPAVGRVPPAALPSGGYLGDDAALAVLPGETVRIIAPTLPPKEHRTTPWSAAADGGAAIGRGSTKAARATAGFFTRIGKSIAGGV